MRLIDADALMPKLKAIHEAESQIYGRGSWRFSLKCIDALEEAPTIEPERKKGRWIVKEIGCKLTSYKCSKCGRYVTDDTGYDVKEDYPFCNCGADMREDTDE